MICRCIVGKGHARWIEYPGFSTERFKQPGRLEGGKAAKRKLAQRPIQQQDARGVCEHGPVHRYNVRPFKAFGAMLGKSTSSRIDYLTIFFNELADM